MSSVRDPVPSIERTSTQESFFASIPPGSTLIEQAFFIASVVAGEDAASELMGAVGVRVAACVLDTNLLLKDIGYSTKRGRLTFLQKAARIGLVRFYISTMVRDEVLEKLREEKGDYADWARRQCIDQVEAFCCWEHDYAPWITVLDPSEFPASPNVEALRLVDPDDVGTAQLIELLRPDAAFSQDKDLRPFGVVQGELTVHARAYLADSVHGASKAGVTVGGGLILVFSASAIQSLLDLLGLFGKLRFLFGLVFAGGAALSLLHTPTRDRVLGGARSALPHLAQAVEFLSVLATLFGELKARAEEARLQVSGTVVEVPKTPT